MKEQSIIRKRAKYDKIDRRDLVNIDLYDNEIKVMDQQLDEVAVRQHKSKAVLKELEQLKKELTIQRESLARFRNNCKTEETCEASAGGVNAVDNGGFFEHLKAFEEDFKNIRNRVNDFVEMYQEK